LLVLSSRPGPPLGGYTFHPSGAAIKSRASWALRSRSPQTPRILMTPSQRRWRIRALTRPVGMTPVTA